MMNREERIERLQSLLHRVQTRAAEPRPIASPGETLASTSNLGISAFSVSMPTPDKVDIDDTRPFAKIPVTPSSELQISESTPGLEVPVEETAFDIDDVGFGGLEIVSEGAGDVFLEEPPSSSRRVMELELDTIGGSADAPRVTPPPESGPQEVSAKPSELQVDDGPIEPRPLAPPSIEMLGNTVELPGSLEGRPIEIDRTPPAPPLRDKSTAEMEAVIPGSLAAGVYPPTESEDKTNSLFVEEPLTQDWEVPEPIEAPPIKEVAQAKTKIDEEDEPFTEPLQIEQPKPKADAKNIDKEQVDVASDEMDSEAITQKPAQLEPSSKEAEPPLPEVEPLQPLIIELAGKPISVPEITTKEVASFVNAIQSTSSVTFLEALDMSLALGREEDG